MVRKRLVSLFYFNDNIAGKDMFLAPKYLAEALDMDCEIVFPKWKENEHLRGEYRGVKLTPIRSKSRFKSTFWTEKAMAWWLMINARRIDVLSLFWLSRRNMIFARIYKLFNPRGICYIKGDFDEFGLLQLRITQRKGIKAAIKKFIYGGIDLVSAETQRSVTRIEQGLFGEHLSKRVVYMPNAFDQALFATQNIEIKSFEKKENLIITVGRIGSKQKNNEMMLRMLDGVDMGDWKVVLIGPIEDGFKLTYDGFIASNPDKVDKVVLRGLISNKKELWEMYNSAKVFLLTSVFE